MNSETQIRILIFDDHHVIREGLKALISTQPDLLVVGEASDGQNASDLFRKHHPDIVLMDLSMPGVGGMEATKTLCTTFPNARVIVLSIRSGDEDIHRSLQAGAKGYLLKDATSVHLFEAVRTVHSGRRYIPTEIATQLAERPPASDLTAREAEILQEIVRGKSNKEIADSLSIAEPTVKFHVSNILIKLGANDRTGAVTIALRRGIVHLD
jgi:two-component system NarL family response regulator